MWVVGLSKAGLRSPCIFLRIVIDFDLEKIFFSTLNSFDLLVFLLLHNFAVEFCNSSANGRCSG